VRRRRRREALRITTASVIHSHYYKAKAELDDMREQKEKMEGVHSEDGTEDVKTNNEPHSSIWRLTAWGALTWLSCANAKQVSGHCYTWG